MLEFIFGALTMFTILFITGLCMQPKCDIDDGERLTVKTRRVK